MKSLILIITILMIQQRITARDTFYWKWQFVEGKIKVSGKLNNGNESAIFIESVSTMKRVALIYKIIDRREYQDRPLYFRIVDTLSSLFVKPFMAAIIESSAIVIEIDSPLITFPVEFLQLGTESLAIIRPLVFKMNNSFTDHNTDTLTLHGRFIIRDHTADPENACINIFHEYSASEFKNAFDI